MQQISGMSGNVNSNVNIFISVWLFDSHASYNNQHIDVRFDAEQLEYVTVPCKHMQQLIIWASAVLHW